MSRCGSEKVLIENTKKWVNFNCNKIVWKINNIFTMKGTLMISLNSGQSVLYIVEVRFYREKNRKIKTT